jgi:hypothetical protein
MTYVRPSSLMVIEENPPLREAAKGSRRYLWIGPARRAVSTLPFPSMLQTARVSLVHHIDRHRLSDELSTNARDARRREIDFSTSGQAIRNVQNVFELAAILSKSAPASGRPTPRYDRLSPMERRILGSRSAAKKEPNRLFSKWQSHN